MKTRVTYNTGRAYGVQDRASGEALVTAYADSRARAGREQMAMSGPGLPVLVDSVAHRAHAVALLAMLGAARPKSQLDRFGVESRSGHGPTGWTWEPGPTLAVTFAATAGPASTCWPSGSAYQQTRLDYQGTDAEVVVSVDVAGSLKPGGDGSQCGRRGTITR